MSDLSLSIKLHRDDGSGGGNSSLGSGKVSNGYSFEPGDEIRGKAMIESAEGAWKADEVELMVFWVTSGIGTRDQGVAYKLDLAKKDETLPAHFTYGFDFKVPFHPYTYHGKLIKIEWVIGLYAKQGWFSKQECEMPIEIRPKLDG